MSTSDKKSNKARALRTGYVYLLLSLFCVLFGGVYERFSHDIYSNYMVYAFLFPLIGGTFIFFSIILFRLRLPNRASSNLYHSGIAALTVGSLLEGVVEIYGTTNELISVYWVVGSVLVAAGVLIYLIGCFNGAKERKKAELDGSIGR